MKYLGKEPEARKNALKGCPFRAIVRRKCFGKKWYAGALE